MKKLELPSYELELPSNKKKIKFRPFTVKEKKILLMAFETGSETDIVEAIKQIIKNCILAPADLNVDDLATFDIEYFFLQLRARSIAETVKAKYSCQNMVNGEPCNGNIDMDINLLDINLDPISEEDKKIALTKDVGIKLKYPSFNSVVSEQSESEVDSDFEYIIDCVDLLYDQDGIYLAKDMPREEIKEFLESLVESQFEKIEKFVDNIPTLKHEFDIECPKCKFNHHVALEGLQSFFV